MLQQAVDLRFEILLAHGVQFLRARLAEEVLQKVVHQAPVFQCIHLRGAALLGTQPITAKVLKPAEVKRLNLRCGYMHICAKELPRFLLVLEPGSTFPSRSVHRSGTRRIAGTLRKELLHRCGKRRIPLPLLRGQCKGGLHGVCRPGLWQAVRGINRHSLQNGQCLRDNRRGALWLALRTGRGKADVQSLRSGAHCRIGKEAFLHGNALQRIVQRQAERDQLPAFPIAKHTMGARREREIALRRPQQENHLRFLRADTVRSADGHFVQALRNAGNVVRQDHQTQELCIPRVAQTASLEHQGALVEDRHQHIPQAQLPFRQLRPSVRRQPCRQFF